MMLTTIRPGPVLHIWRDGADVAAMPLSPIAGLQLARDLLAAVAACPSLTEKENRWQPQPPGRAQFRER